MSDPSEFNGRLLNEYYSIPMALLHTELATDIRDASTSRPKAFERALMASLISKEAGSAAIQWDALLDVANNVEAEIASVLSERHVLFWQHLYRRVFPAVRDEDGRRVSATTNALVRSICESAIVKHGRLAGHSGLEDIATTDIENVLGGWLAKSVRQLNGTDAEGAERFLGHYKQSHQWVIVDFETNDLLDLYYVEGLCFQYWKITARLRSIGKGRLLLAYADGSSAYVPSDLDGLLVSYDVRAAQFSSAESSALGIWYEGPEDGDPRILCFQPNSDQVDIGDAFRPLGLDLNSGDGTSFVPNFLPFFLDGNEFLSAHSYIADEFKRRKGFSLAGLVELLQFLSALALGRYARDHAEVYGTDVARAYSFLQLCKRAYVLMSVRQAEELKLVLRQRLQASGVSDEEFDAMIRSITLSDATRSSVSLWSRGPQFVFFLYEESALIDFCGIVELLHNLFVGVKDDANARGMAFEANVRASITARGIKLEARNFKFQDGSEAEADAVFFKDGKLIVVDCFSMWRPLDFEISRPKTVAYRNRMLEEKAGYALARSEKLKSNMVGRNFDFSKAVGVETVIVTPMVEWLWTRSDLLWIQPNVPRVMQANEFIAWATGDVE